MANPSHSPAQRKTIALTMALMGASFWLLGRPYYGIYHDAILYAFQGLARLHPDSLGGDIFLRYGSQDSYTLFSPVYAWFIDAMGLDDAARALTIIGHAWWLGAAFAISRIVLGPRRAWLGIALLAGLPGYYGAWAVFRFAEPFLTARIFAEAASLTAIALALKGRRTAAGGFSLLALVLHPIMAAPGVLISTALGLPLKLARLMPVAVVVGLVLACFLAVALPHYPISTFDHDWLALVRLRSPFLFMVDWNEDAWCGVTAALVGLWILGTATEGPARRLFTFAVIVGVLGLLITAVGADGFKVVLLTQGQTWRWIWVAAALLAIAAVSGVPSAWRGGPLHRAALALLLSGLLLRGLPAVALFALATILWQCRKVEWSPGIARAIELASIAICLASIYIWILGIPSLLTVDTTDVSATTGLGRVRHLTSDGVVPTLVVASAWLLGNHRPKWTGLLLAFALIVAIKTAVSLAGEWLQTNYEPDRAEELAAWKQTIPDDAEVFWIEHSQAAWFLLKRRHYASQFQTAGAVFSRDAAMALLARSRETTVMFSPSMAFDAGSGIGYWNYTGEDMRHVCRQSQIDYMVTPHRLALPTVVGPLHWTHSRSSPDSELFLYSCQQLTEARASELETIS